MKLIESLSTSDNDVPQQPDDGAALNFLASYQRNGRVWGAALSKTDNYTITIQPGLLIARGYRLRIESAEKLLDLSGASLPSATVSYSLFIRITRTSHNATFAVGYTASTLQSAAIDQTDGSFDLKIATMALGPSGIVGLTDALSTITAPSGSGSSASSVGGNVPAPKLELVWNRDEAGGAYNAFLCLKNKGDYNALRQKYTVKFVLCRYVQAGAYRHRSGTTKIYAAKTGYVVPAERVSTIGWSTTKIATSVLWTGLTTETIGTNGSYVYSRTDVLLKIADACQALFYDAGTAWTAKTAITASTRPWDIRSVRSKKGKLSRLTLYKGHHRHNFAKFAYKCLVYDGSTLVAQSDVGNSVTITPNLAYPLAGTSGKWASNLGGLFKVRIE